MFGLLCPGGNFLNTYVRDGRRLAMPIRRVADDPHMRLQNNLYSVTIQTNFCATEASLVLDS